MIIEFTATDLPEPVVPAMSRWGALARSKTYGMPSMSLPTHMVSRLPAFWNDVLLGDLLEVHRLAVAVGHLDAHHALAGDGRDDAHPHRLHRHGEVVRERGDLRAP